MSITVTRDGAQGRIDIHRLVQYRDRIDASGGAIAVTTSTATLANSGSSFWRMRN